MLWKVTVKVRNKKTKKEGEARFAVDAGDAFEAKLIVAGATEGYKVLSMQVEKMSQRMVALS